jgi:hypothetical protein
MSQDPLGEMGGLNLYSYILNDPISKIELHTPTIARAVPKKSTLAQLLDYEHFSIEVKLAYL